MLALGQFCIAQIGDKTCTLTNQLLQTWKSNPRPFTIDGVEYTKLTKKSTTVPSKAVKTRWFTYSDQTSIEVVEGSDYEPHKDIEAVAYRTVRTWYIVE